MHFSQLYQKDTLRESFIYTAACQGRGYALSQLSKRLLADNSAIQLER